MLADEVATDWWTGASPRVHQTIAVARWPRRGAWRRAWALGAKSKSVAASPPPLARHLALRLRPYSRYSTRRRPLGAIDASA